MMIMRWQLAYPGQPIPLIGPLAVAIQNFLARPEHAVVAGQFDPWFWLRDRGGY